MSRRRPVELRDGLVLVTGAGSGIGRATSVAFAQRGARVLATDIDLAAAEATAKECLAAGAPLATGLRCDVSDLDAMLALAAGVHAEHGPLDVLVNNAGVGMSGHFLDTTPDDWQWIRSVNVDGVMNGCRAFGPAMLEQRHGQVVNVSSGLAYTPRAPEALYCTTKAAVLMFSQGLRADWGRQGVGVTAVCPGVIDTPILASTRFSGTAERERAQRVFRHGHKPELVAKVIVRAVERDPAVATAGIEAKLGWFAHRALPLALTDRIARLEIA